MALLDKQASLCEDRQKIIISKDKRSAVSHRADNRRHRYHVRQYQLDGNIVKNRKCCDFLLLNDCCQDAYLIELKGRNISDAIPQLQAGEQILKEELKDYRFYYRIVCSKVKQQERNKNTFRKFWAECGSRLKCDSGVLEDIL